MTDATKVWMPDTFFRNEKIGAFHTILQPNLYIRIFPDGTVLYSIRYEELGIDMTECVEGVSDLRVLHAPGTLPTG